MNVHQVAGIQHQGSFNQATIRPLMPDAAKVTSP